MRPSATQMIFNQRSYQPASKTMGANVALCIVCHAFTSCDKISVIYLFQKTSLFKKLRNSKKLRNIADIFYKDQQNPKTTGTTAITFFEALQSVGLPLPEFREKKYDNMIADNQSDIDPSVEPTSPTTSAYHGLRVYHQIKV